MGGQEGSRGYLYQAITAVLKSIREDDWEMVQMEPKTDEDKVDILLKYEGDTKRVIQVKSSINNFTKSQILKWFKQLIADCKDAKIYEIILIGTCSDETKKFINSIQKLQKNNWDKSVTEVYEQLDDEMKNIKDKLEICLINNNLTSIEANINLEFMKFLNSKGYVVDVDTTELIVGAINYQYGVFSTNGDCIKRTDFEEKILKWVDLCYPKLSLNTRKKISLSVEFYKNGEFKKQIEKIQTNLKECEIIKNKIDDLIIDCKKIQSINLGESTRIKNFDSHKENYWTLNNKYINPIFKQEKVQFSNCFMEEIESNCKKYLNININKEEFFYLRDLEESSFTSFNFNGSKSNKLYGTVEEKNKYSLINDFNFKLIELEEYLEFFTHIDNFKFIPLVLRNLGEKYDEKIKVQIEVPKFVKIINKKNIPKPGRIILENFVETNGIMYEIFIPKDEFTINKYEHKYTPIPTFCNPFETFETETNNLNLKFKNIIKSLFDYNVYNLNDTNIAEFKFKELKAKENVYFPVYLAVETNRNFTINYKITSKQLGNYESGSLDYKLQL